MPNILIKDAQFGHELPNKDKEAVHQEMQEHYAEGGVASVKYKDLHTKGILIDKDGFIQMSLRSPNARDNAGLIDFSWGAHVEAGDSELTSAMYQSARELGIATTVLDDKFFYSMLENHPGITSELAVTRRLAYLRNFQSERVLPDGNKWIEPCELTVFSSYFDGKFRPEAANGAGMVFYDINSLQEAVSQDPERFTSDVRAIVQRYAYALVPFTQLDEFNPNRNPRANELIQQFDLGGNPIEAVSRKEAHQSAIEAFHAGKPAPTKHKHIRVMLRRPDGSWYLQQRSMNKKENAGLTDKPVAGHVGLGDEYDSAVIHECSDEMGIAAAVLKEEDLNALVRNRAAILDHQAVLTRVATLEGYVSKGRTLKGKEPWEEICDTAVYFGVYNGTIKFKDGESTGVEVKGTNELKKELQEHPKKYTHDLVDLVNLLEQRGFI